MLAVYIYCLVVATAASTLMLFRSSDICFQITTSLVTCQIVQVMMLAGLSCRSALAGIGVGCLVAVLSLALLGLSELYMSADSWRIFMVFPFHITVAALPLLIARFVWGWQLIRHPTDTIPYRKLRIEDFFLLTASVAAVWMLYWRSVDERSTIGNILFVLVPGFVMHVACLVLMGVVYLYFRRGLDEISLFCVLCLAYLPHNLLVAALGGFRLVMSSLLSVVVCAMVSLVGFFIYRAVGLRLVHYEGKVEQAEEQLSDQDRQYLIRSRSSARVSAALFLLVAVIAVAVVTTMDRYKPEILTID